jgi:DNA-binding NtrC family response regulator
VLLYDQGLSSQSRTALLNGLQSLFGQTGRSVCSATFLFQRAIGMDGTDLLRRSHAHVVGSAIHSSGNFAGAAAATRISAQDKTLPPTTRARAICTQITAAFEQLRWGELFHPSFDDVLESLASEARHLTVVRGFVAGYRGLAAAEYGAAATNFRNVMEANGQGSPGESRSLYLAAADALHASTLLRRIRATQDCRGAGTLGPDHLVVAARRIIVTRGAGPSLGLTVRLLEDWARRSGPSEPEVAISLALLLRENWNSGFQSQGGSVIAAIAGAAPHLFGRIAEAALQSYAVPVPSSSEPEAVDTTLGVLAGFWDCSTISPDCGECELILSVPPMLVGTILRDGARHQKRDAQAWGEDAALYWAARDAARISTVSNRGGSNPHVVMAGCIGGTAARWHRRVHEVCGSDLGAAVFVGRARERPGLASQDGFATNAVDAGQSRASTKNFAGRMSRRNASADLVFVGSSSAACQVREEIRRAAACSLPVLLVGETGTGKELVARVIHREGGSSSLALQVADCGAIAESVMETELFGCVRGAYSGASSDRPGLFEVADGTTLMLDEVESMSRRMQAATLRVLDRGEFRRVGDNKVRRARFRVIAAASTGIYDMLSAGQFRQDLYYRLSGLVVNLPALRDRVEDSAEIAEWYVRRHGRKLWTGAQSEILHQDWPGNVRQLLHCMDVAMALDSGLVVGRAAIDEAFALSARGAESREATAQTSTGSIDTPSAGVFQAGEQFSIHEYMAATRLARRTAQRNLARLVATGQLRRIGAGRATSYEAKHTVDWPAVPRRVAKTRAGPAPQS